MTIRQYLELQQTLPENFDTKTEYFIECVSIYKDTSTEKVQEMNYDELIKVFRSMDITPKPAVDSIKLRRKTLYKIPFMKLTLGEWIDLEHYMTKSDTILEVLSVLYRQKTDGDVWTEDTYEEYSNFVNKRKNIFLETKAINVIQIKKEYLDFRNKVLESYEGLFSIPFDEDYGELTQYEIEEQERLDEIEKDQASFIWEETILGMCNNDITKMDIVLKTPFILVFNVMSANKKRMERERANARKNKN
tara:strand:- start:81 stop:824 length:744 start_codon:yes stop_codon:yes gene_type:complete